jgi:hypothetical protein
MSVIKVLAAQLPDDRFPSEEEYDQANRWAGSFNTQKAEWWAAADGSTDRVWRTPSGRWVFTSKPRDCYLTVTEARAWLAANGHSDVIVQHIDREQDAPGRPEIGPEIKFRVPAEVRDAIEEMAKRNGISRADQLRMIVMDVVPLGV